MTVHLTRPPGPFEEGRAMPTPSTAATRRGLITAAAVGGASAALGLSAASPGLAAKPRRAATVIVGGQVFSGLGGRSTATAVAIDRDGAILEVGSNAEVRRLIGPGTNEIDAA